MAAAAAQYGLSSENYKKLLRTIGVDLNKWSSTAVHGLEDNNSLQSDLQKYFSNLTMHTNYQRTLLMRFLMEGV